MDEPDYVREGWDKRGARSRLDRRRTVKEAVKRRAIQGKTLASRSVHQRRPALPPAGASAPRPATNAAVIFALDVSGSMDEAQRRLAKQFFFFALQGIRRQYAKVETVFLAHAAEAWEFDESQFFQASVERRHGVLERVQARARDHARRATTRAATTSISSTPPTARTPPRTATRRAPTLARARAGR